MTITHDTEDDYWTLKKGEVILLHPDNEIVEFVEHIYDGCFYYREMKSHNVMVAHKDDFKQKVQYR